ncbi:MAG: dTDP-4-dehydrorhamnose 3,5-epimerase family protein [Sphingobium sp.]
MTAGFVSRAECLPDGAVLFSGPNFADDRGSSYEAFFGSADGSPLPVFPLVQENIIRTARAGCIRGLHYQLAPKAQGKLVTVLRGRAQIFWVALDDTSLPVKVHSLCLDADGASLYTPGNCAHGVMALEDDMLMALKFDQPVDLDMRGEISIEAEDIDIRFERPPLLDDLSKRDREAPVFAARRR